MSPQQMMLLFITFPEKSDLHAALQGEYGPLPHPLRLLPLMCFLSLTASELTSVYSWVCKYRFMSNQSCHSTPNVTRIALVPPWNCAVTASHVKACVWWLSFICPRVSLLVHFWDRASCPVRISRVVRAPVHLIWDLVSSVVITGAVCHFLGETWCLYQSRLFAPCPRITCRSDNMQNQLDLLPSSKQNTQMQQLMALEAFLATLNDGLIEPNPLYND